MSRRGARVGIVLGLGVAAGGLLLVDGCSAVLGIGDLPIDDGGADGSADAPADRTTDRTSPDHTSPDRTSPDHATPDVSAEASGCTPACTGKTPYCLDHTCVACKPSSVQCSPAGAPQECNSGGTWVPAPACGGSTPFCFEGNCVQCLPAMHPNACVEGGLGFCSDSGVLAVDDCPCANAECQRWPTGKRGDCHFDAGTTTRFDPGVVLDCKSLEIEADATVAFEPADGGAPDGAAKWSVIGVVGNAVIDGVIVSQVDSLGHAMTAKHNVPSADGGPGEELVYVYEQAEGGVGGSAGWMCEGDFADGGPEAFGNGGGGGGGGVFAGKGAIYYYPGYCPVACGPENVGGPGEAARQWSAGNGGAAPEGGTPPTEGGAGATTFGGGGGGANAPLLSSASGAGGGFRGRHGGLVYLRVVGTLTGAGGVDLSGQAGGAGGSGSPPSWFASGGGACGPLVATDYTYVGSAAGGGGAGGAGGAFVLRYEGDASAFLSRVRVSGGNGGATGPGGNGDQQPGQSGATGVIDAGPIPP